MTTMMGRDAGEVGRVESDRRDSEIPDGDEITRKVLLYDDLKALGDEGRGEAGVVEGADES